MKSSITNIENTLEGISSRSGDAKEWISDLENRVWKADKLNSKKKRITKNESRLSEIKWNNICIIGIPKNEERRG